ncbi:unnamed protein product [Sphacelaria rigidula]
MRHPDRRTPPPDTDRGEHRARGERGRTSTRRSSSQGLPGNRDSCSRVHSAPAGSTPVSSMRRGKGHERVCHDVCGIQFPVVDDDACNTCSSCNWIHDPVSRLCFAYHGPGSGKGNVWHHLGAARIPEARLFLESCADGDGIRPAALVPNYQPSSDCLCDRHDCLLRLLERHRIASERKVKSLSPVRCTPATVGLTPPPSLPSRT